MISPKLVEVGRHTNIELITCSEVKDVEGDPGNFAVTLSNHPRYIDPVKCTGCGECARHCPVTAVNGYNLKLDDRRATYIEYAQAVPLAFSIDTDTCIGCGLCENMCIAKAVEYDDTERETRLTVGSVVMAAGSRGFDPSGLDYLGYGRYPNVVTSEEFERILSASGPYFGHLMRPLDREEPKRIAWLQCVGSRDKNRCGNGYCSSVCCMYAVKEAMIAKEHAHGDLDCVVFNMDMRTFGKDYELYYNRAKDKDGVTFLKARIHSVTEVPDRGDLIVKYADDTGRMQEEIFSMVVLSIGLQVQPDAAELAQRLGIELNEYNFVKTDTFAPVTTSRPGFYTCGVLQGPKDIPGSITEASAAAWAAGADLVEGRGTDIPKIEVPEQRDVTQEEPRIGVFVCNCGINIGGIVDVPAVREYAATLPGVAFSDDNLFTCSQDTQDKIKDVITEHRLNRVVVASCSPKTHAAMFMETLEACGLNKYLFEMANIRNQNSWIHSADSDVATQKAKDLVRMSVARAARLRTLNEKVVPINKKALVIGGGIAGMNAAIGLGDQGFETVLLERESELGGFARNLHHTIEGGDIQAYVNETVDKVNAHDKVEVITKARITGAEGFKGSFSTEIEMGEAKEKRAIDHGVILVATGANEYQPTEFLYGEDDRVVTQVELTDRLHDKGASDLDAVVMIQCVGSRNEEHENCSRICCQSAVKNALEIKKQSPDTQVFVLYRDIRTYGLLEDYYTEAREKGVIFIRFDKDTPPRVTAEADALRVTVKDHILQQDVEIRTDLLALSAGLRAADTDDVSSIMKFNRNPEGYFIEAHVKLRPVDMPSEGVFLCGTAHGPKLITETIAQAQAAASRATTFLAKDAIKLSAITAKVDTEHCVKCLTCVRSCPFGVPQFNTEKMEIEINEALCHGCGVCTAVCPRQVIGLSFYEDDQLMCKIDALLDAEVV
ncbi:heterodisulfide reductase, subunit A/methylviologen reducing hydrogenase, subunit delta [Olavius algarvensis associated proteobacterium Delta 3]|nr:heterodisulfide reductase, subunit A/methylviologen reducing hydrogenase, subunit delta [Olavius algarvensis associated proteobacterium Delta 3]CAB5117721.1 heterodisulfide reductase, subunit A/methylviologen reducing hydrogenase, subunit delta [Olavius algarvensis associated proteobacterium Delta 3]